MGNGLADLDRALDDTIRMKRKSNNATHKRGGATVPAARSQPRSSNVNTNKIRKDRLPSSKSDRNVIRGRNDSSIAINARISGGINTRLSSSKGGIHKPHNNSLNTKRGVRGPTGLSKSSTLVSKTSALPLSNLKSKTKIDPSQLIITKSITNKPKKVSAESLIINRNIGKPNPQQQQKPQKRQQPQQQQQQHQSSYNDNDYQQSYQQQPSNSQPNPPSVNQKNIVLLCNLDPRVSAQDVGETCSVFGPVLSCDMLLDPMGRPLNEAEIEFMYPDSAEECVAKLDNNFADGRILRAKLQDKPTIPIVPRYSSRTVGASARVAPGGFHNNNQSGPMMQQQSYHQSSYYQQPQSYHQYQRRY